MFVVVLLFSFSWNKKKEPRFPKGRGVLFFSCSVVKKRVVCLFVLERAKKRKRREEKRKVLLVWSNYYLQSTSCKMYSTLLDPIL